MAASGRSRADENRRIRQDELREKLRAGAHVDHVIDIANKLADLNIELEATEINRLKAAADIKKGLIAKYLPDLKSIEHTGEIGHRNADALTDEELAAIATSSRTGATEEADSAQKVH